MVFQLFIYQAVIRSQCLRDEVAHQFLVPKFNALYRAGPAQELEDDELTTLW